MRPAIRLPGELTITAASADGKGPPRLSILAYNGGELRISGWPNPVVIDLAGAKPAKSIIVNKDHDPTQLVGHVTETLNDGKSLRLNGIISGTGPAAQEITANYAAGFPYQASIEAQPANVENVPEGKKATANGRVFEGPVNITRQSKLYGVAILGHGADEETHVTIAAKRGARKMGVDYTNLDSIRASTDPGDQALLASISTDPQELMERRKEVWIRAGKAEQGEELAQQVAAGVLTEADFAELTSKEYRRHRDATVPQGFGIVASRPRTSPDVYAAALFNRVKGDTHTEKLFGAQTAEAAHGLKRLAPMDIFKAAASQAGRQVHGLSNSEFIDGEMRIHASVSTMTVPNLLSNLAGKSLELAYMETPATWRLTHRVKSAANFHTQTGIRPALRGKMEILAPGGNIKHGTMAETTYNWFLDTYAKIFSVDRRDIINDSLGAFDELPAMHGRMAMRGVSDLCWETVMANAGNFFHANNANLLSGSGGKLDEASLKLLYLKMRQQRDSDNNDLDIVPITLVVPPELKFTAEALLQSDAIQRLAEDSGVTGNSLKNILQLAVEPRLSNTAKFDDASATAWFLFASPADAAAVVGFLEGQQTPHLNFFGLDNDPNKLAYTWQVYFDYGAALGDPKAACKSTGEAGSLP